MSSLHSLSRRKFLAGSAVLCAIPAWGQDRADLTADEVAPLRRDLHPPIIDAHTHYAGEHPRVVQWMADNGVKLLNVGVAVQNDNWRNRAEVYRRLAQEHPARYAWCTRFTQPNFLQPDFSEQTYVARVLRQFEQDFAAGAHLGSLEYDVDELAQRFDRYPIFAADTSGTARIGDLAHQDRDKVRAFFFATRTASCSAPIAAPRGR